tara:strand:- start:731 stop:841 length:111 start_codon:yes stop_codon:yes gene_type:complete
MRAGQNDAREFHDQGFDGGAVTVLLNKSLDWVAARI